MGEFADYANERWADGEWEEEEEDEIYIGKTCRYCGKSGLEWEWVEGKGWRLAERAGDGLHVCERFKAPKAKSP